MLILKVAAGDDIYVGPIDNDIETYDQIIVKDLSGGVVTLLTPTEVLEIPTSDWSEKVDLGVWDIRITAKESMSRLGPEIHLGFIADDNIKILRGRTARRLAI